jgi:hypothetical protein
MFFFGFHILNLSIHVAGLPELALTEYRVSQKECARLDEGVPYGKVYRYNPKHLRAKLNGYRDNGQRSLKLRQLLHTC